MTDPDRPLELSPLFKLIAHKEKEDPPEKGTTRCEIKTKRKTNSKPRNLIRHKPKKPRPPTNPAATSSAENYPGI